MSDEYSGEQIQRAIANMRVANLDELEVERMLTAYAERIKADEGAVPARGDLDVIRQAIEERDAAMQACDDLAQRMVYKGNSVGWWHSKATAYRAAIEECWKALGELGIRADGKTHVADVIRTLTAPVNPPAQAAQLEAPPHCKGHMQFEYDCLDCSDVLERKRKASTAEPVAQGDLLTKMTPDAAAAYRLGWRDALAAQPRAVPSVPDGWVLVPVRPDMKMSRAAYAAWERVMSMGALRPNDTTMPFVIWDAMLAAAPQPGESLQADECTCSDISFGRICSKHSRWNV